MAFTPFRPGQQSTQIQVIELQQTLLGALSGLLRLANNAWLTARNAANTANVNLVRMNASNQVEIGGDIGVLVPWTAFTPQLQQGTNLTTGVSKAKYCILGHTAIVQFRIQALQAGTAWSEIGVVGLPAALNVASYELQLLVGQYRYEDYGTSVTSGGVMMDYPGRYHFMLPNSTAVLGASALAVAVNDSLEVNCLYEV